MNIAIGIGTMLLGGWVLNTSGTNDQSNTATTPSSSASSALPPGVGSQRQGKGEDMKDTKERGSQEGTGTQGGQQPKAPGSEMRSSNQGPMRWLLPTPPTEPGRARLGEQYLMPTPPTGVGRDAEYNGQSNWINPSGSPNMPYVPQVPTSRQAYSPRNLYSPSYYEYANESRKDSTFGRFSDFRTPPAAEKPFRYAQPFSSGVSPYMGMFRNDTANGTIDNYTTMVRPQLDQRSMNQQFNLDIYGLERSARLQQAAMRQMGRNLDRAPQTIGTPQFYQNFNTYYPGLGPNAAMQQGYGQ